MAATLLVDVQPCTHARTPSHTSPPTVPLLHVAAVPACLPKFRLSVCLCDQVNTADWNDRLGLNQRFVSNNVVGALVFGGILAGTLV